MILTYITKKRVKVANRITGNGSEYAWNDESGATKTLNLNGYLEPLPAMSTGVSNDCPPEGATLAFFNTLTTVEYVRFTPKGGTPTAPVLGNSLPVPPQRYVYFTVPVEAQGVEVSSAAIAVMLVKDSTTLG